jgi:hypothetical protein
MRLGGATLIQRRRIPPRWTRGDAARSTFLVLPIDESDLPLESCQGLLTEEFMHRRGRLDNVEVEVPVWIVRNDATAETDGREGASVECWCCHVIDAEQPWNPAHEAAGHGEIDVGNGHRFVILPAKATLERDEAIRTIREAIDRALAIDPTIGEAYANLAGLAWAFDRDLEQAAGLLEQAVRLDPWNLDVLKLARDFIRAIGDLEGSRDLGAYILRRDPLCIGCRTQYAGTLECLGDLDAAERELRVVEEIAPDLSVAAARGRRMLGTTGVHAIRRRPGQF